MIKSVYINNRPHQIADGIAIKETATEELDSCVFQILNTEPISLEPMQKVMIEFEDDTRKYFIINTWVDSPATFDTNLKNYIISCSSETKKLERVQLPNLTITQPLSVEGRKTYYYYVNALFANYIVKLYPELSIDRELYEEFRNQIAIEEQFNSLSAKDYFNKVLEKFVKLVKVENNVITAIPLNKKGDAIDTNKLFFTTNEEKIEDYYSQIRSDVQGVQSDDSTVITELVGMRAPDSAFLTTDNAVIKLSHNINYIKKVTCYVHFDYYTHKNQFVTAHIHSDTRKSVVEKAEYDLMKVSNVANLFDDDLKRMHLYYTRGSNTIEGFNYDEGKLLDSLMGKTPLINIVSKLFLEKQLEEGTAYLPENFEDIRDVKFEVTYSALDDVSLIVDKNKNFNSEIRDNQTESFVDLDKFAKSEQLKLNRLGNPTMPIAGRYDRLEDVPKLFDYIGDYILAEKEVVYHSEYIDFKGVLYKNYINRDIFYGVNAKRRTTPLLSGSEAVTRKDLTKIKYKFDFEDTTEDKTTTRYLLGQIASTNYFDEESITKPDMKTSIDFKPIAIAVGTSIFFDLSEKYYKLEPDVRKANNSVTINFKFEDNINVGIKQSGIKTFGGYSQEYVSYTDSYGELYALRIELYDNYTLSDFDNDKFDLPNSFPDFDKSILMDNYKFLSLYSRKNKDGGEILNETIQIEFNDSENIFVNDRLIDMLPFFQKTKKFLRIWTSKTQKYNKQNKDVVVTDAEMQIDNLEIDYSDFVKFNEDFTTFNRLMLYNNDVDLTNVKSWALADVNGNVYIAVNKRNTDAVIPTTIYLNKEE